MLRGLQMPTSRKVGLAVLFLIAITDVIFDITRTVYTINIKAVALDTTWDILESTIAVIVSSLPTYKALLGPTKKWKNTRYQNLDHSGTVIGKSLRRPNTEESNDVELSISPGKASKKGWTNVSSEVSRDAVDTTNVM